MRKYITLFFSVSLFLCACSNEPSGVIDQEHMTSLLVDVHIADGSLMNMPQQPDSLYKYGTAKFTAIFKKHNTDSTAFKKSYKYYTMHPAVFTAIYDSVLSKMKVKSDSLTNLVAKQNVEDAKKRGISGQHPMGPGVNKHLPIPANPSFYNSQMMLKRQERARFVKDSIAKRNLKLHALPKQQH
jgi:hypothetical protein